MPSLVVEQALSVLELRQYTLHPGRRDELVALFEREFVEPQEAAGARLVATFRDLDDPDRFVWIRGFADMAARADALAAFYGGPVWKRHRDAANATLMASDDVRRLRPFGGDRGLRAALLPPTPRRAGPGLGLPRPPRVARPPLRRSHAAAPRTHPRSALRRRHTA